MALQIIDKTKKVKILSGILAFVFMILLLPAQVFAIGQITSPIVIKDALRGGEYRQTMTVVNTDQKKSLIGLAAEGDIAGWVKFYNLSDLKKPIESISLEKGARLNVYAVFSIPKDTPNGEYKGFVSVSRKTDSASSIKNESTVAISQKIDRTVTIDVSGKQIVKLDASIIPNTYDLKKNEPLSIRVIYANQGNISVVPQVQIKIYKVTDNTVIYNSIYPYPDTLAAIMPDTTYEIPAIEIPTGSFPSGKYLAELNISQDGKDVLQKSFGFSLDVANNLAASVNTAQAAGLDSTGKGTAGVSNIILILIGAAALGIVYVLFKRFKAAK